MALAFNTLGATPSQISPSQKVGSYFDSIQASNPVSKALSSMQKPVVPTHAPVTQHPISQEVIHPDGTKVVQKFSDVTQGNNKGLIKSTPSPTQSPAQTPTGAPINGNSVGIDFNGALKGSNQPNPQPLPVSPVNINEQNATNAQSALSAFAANGGVNPNGPTSSATTYPGLISSLTNSANQNPSIGQNARDIASSYGQQIADIGQRGAMAQAGYRSTGTTPVAEGNAAVNAQTTAAQQQALAQGESAALQGTGQQLTAQNQQQSGLGTAADLTRQGLIQLPYSNQLYNQTTGQFVQGGNSLNDAVNNVTTQLKNGQIGYEDAKSQLSGYGQAGLNALSKWATDNNFSIAQSNTLAGQQGSVAPAFEFAKTALSHVEDTIKNLGVAQGTNIPAINAAGNWFSTTFGVNSAQTREYIGAVNNLRNAYAALLASAKGGTPTDYSGQALAEIPNEPTPNDLIGIRANFEKLGQARKDIYGNPGQNTGQGTGQGTTSPGSVSVGGSNFVQDSQGNWVVAK